MLVRLQGLWPILVRSTLVKRNSVDELSLNPSCGWGLGVWGTLGLIKYAVRNASARHLTPTAQL